jgi:hypothetical protein
MHISELKKSNFLTRNDCGSGILVTIDHLSQMNVAKEGAPEELRWVIHFKEEQVEKPMVLNSTNGQIIASIVKSEETDLWAGHKIVLYDDPTVSFGGKLVGGIRVRAPKGRAAAAPVQQPTRANPPPPPAPMEDEEEQDDVPF